MTSRTNVYQGSGRNGFQNPQKIQSYHIRNDELQNNLFELPSRLKLLVQLQNIHDQNDPEIKLQLDDARASIKHDLQKLDEQGVSVNDFLAKFGQEMMEAKIVESRYLLRRFGKPHRDFVQLFREQAEYNKERELMDQKELQQRLDAAKSIVNTDTAFQEIVKQIVSNELLKLTPIATIGDGIPIPSVNVAQVQPIKEVEQAISTQEEILPHLNVAVEFETQAQIQEKNDHDKPAENFEETTQALRQVDEQHDTQPESKFDKIQNFEDMMEYLHTEKLLNKKRMLKSKKSLHNLHGMVTAMGHLSSIQKQQIRHSLDQLYQTKILNKDSNKLMQDQI